MIAEGGIAGYGFSLQMEPAVARDMARWDAYAKTRGAPLWRLLGRRASARVPLGRDDAPAIKPDWQAAQRAIREKRHRLLHADPFAWGSLEAVQTLAAAAAECGVALALLAPHAHLWEIAWCATLAGAGERVILRREPETAFAESPDTAGIGVNWALEPAFAAIRWLDPPAGPLR